MGLYNEYGDIQLKVGNLQCKCFKIGEEVEIPDGIYLGYEGIVVVKKGKFTTTFNENQLFDKYGNGINVEEIINKDNPIYQFCNDVKGKIGKFKKGGKNGLEVRNKKRK